MCCPLTAGSTVPRAGTDHSGAQASRVEPRDLDDGGFLKMTLQLGLGGGAGHMARPGRDSTSKEVGRGWRARTGSWTGPRSLQEQRSHDDGGTGSPPVHADLLVSLASLRSLGLGQRLCNPPSSRTPRLPCPWASSGWASQGGLHTRTQGCGGGAGPGRTKSLDQGGVQCPSRGDSGSVSRPPPGVQWALVPGQPLVVEIPTASPLC